MLKFSYTHSPPTVQIGNVADGMPILIDGKPHIKAWIGAGQKGITQDRCSIAMDCYGRIYAFDTEKMVEIINGPVTITVK